MKMVSKACPVPRARLDRGASPAHKGPKACRAPRGLREHGVFRGCWVPLVRGGLTVIPVLQGPRDLRVWRVPRGRRDLRGRVVLRGPRGRKVYPG